MDTVLQTQYRESLNHLQVSPYDNNYVGKIIVVFVFACFVSSVGKMIKKNI